MSSKIVSRNLLLSNHWCWWNWYHFGPYSPHRSVSCKAQDMFGNFFFYIFYIFFFLSEALFSIRTTALAFSALIGQSVGLDETLSFHQCAVSRGYRSRRHSGGLRSGRGGCSLQHGLEHRQLSVLSLSSLLLGYLKISHEFYYIVCHCHKVWVCIGLQFSCEIHKWPTLHSSNKIYDIANTAYFLQHVLYPIKAWPYNKSP